MNIIPQRSHSGREFPWICIQFPGLVALRRHPPIVQYQIPVARIAHARPGHGICHLSDLSLIDLGLETIPAVPAHGGVNANPSPFPNLVTGVSAKKEKLATLKNNMA